MDCVVFVGPEGWRAATAQGATPDDVHFRWSPKHQDLEVISKNSLPLYLYAPGENKPRLLILPPIICSFFLFISFFLSLISPVFFKFLASFPFLSGPGRSGPIRSCPVLSGPVLTRCVSPLLQLLTWGTRC